MSIEITKLPFRIPDIMLPNKSIDMHTWSVIACDQFTSDASYWQEVKNIVQDRPSTLHLILPEYILSENDETQIQDHFTHINNNAQYYLKNNIFDTYENALILTRRTLTSGHCRSGVMIQVDLNAYSAHPQDVSAIKASEAIVESRLPRRIQVRKSSNIDTPHILMLYFDKENSLLTQLRHIQAKTPLYDTPLMLGGGSITGHLCDTQKGLRIFQDFFLTQSLVPLLIVGDGNHALMSAKKVWQERGSRLDDPERWALVELVNIYDTGISIEPIHRVLFDVDSDAIIQALKEYGTVESITKELLATYTPKDTEVLICGNTTSYIWNITTMEAPITLAIELLETILTQTQHLYTHIDFIHSPAAVLSLANDTRQTTNRLGFILPQITQEHIFDMVHTKKLFPRKAFSIGEEIDKRYYLESCLKS